ncbi:MAG: hypothetical protein KAV45_05460 [Calditrichia bacterium]|jgi:hypothetical protein|nr:hypothetical protein [Calditrichia bacterium]
MNNFFTVIVIIAVSILIFVIYYTSKNLYYRYRQRILKSEIQKKRYEDEKKYIRYYLKSLLSDLESGKLSWILISSRLYPEVKLELIYNSIDKNIQIQHRIRNVGSEELNMLKNLGLQTYDIKNDLFCFNVSINSKIVTDIVYFVLEQVSKQTYAHNIKVVTSGGSE